MNNSTTHLKYLYDNIRYNFSSFNKEDFDIYTDTLYDLVFTTEGQKNYNILQLILVEKKTGVTFVVQIRPEGSYNSKYEEEVYIQEISKMVGSIKVSDIPYAPKDSEIFTHIKNTCKKLSEELKL